MERILCATDYSEPSRLALGIATSLARDHGARLLITHVLQTESGPVGEIVDEELAPNPEEVQRLQAVVPNDASVPFEHRLICPPPSSENVHPAEHIVRLAEQEHVDAIVLGTHGRSGLVRLLAGGVAHSVMRLASCPVIVAFERIERHVARRTNS
jgi:nucleotide-binding universal stress UspA family protein